MADEEFHQNKNNTVDNGCSQKSLTNLEVNSTICHTPTTKLDRHGLPLVPQPSSFKDDPLNWPTWLKWVVLIQASFMAFLGPFNAATINPSLVLLSKAMGVNTKVAAYSTTTCIIAGGVSPFIWNPLTNVYGRRPIALLTTLMTIAGGVGSACSPNFATLVGTRFLCGAGFGGMMSVGTAIVNDMFFFHERGEKTGIYSIFVTNGAHIAALIGGYIGQAGGWQWDYWTGVILTSFALFLAVLLFPETLFCRDAVALARKTHERTYVQMLFDFRHNRSQTREIHIRDFFYAFRMLSYPSVLFPFWYYTLSWTFINVLPAISLASIYTKFYHLKSGPIGVCLGISLTIGSVLGELCAGRASDTVMYRMAKRHNGERKPEYRLYLSPLSAIFMPAGVLIFGGLLGKTGYAGPLVGLGIGSFGLQICSTTLYSYISDCYKPQTPETGILFNLSRGLSFAVGYFALPLAESIGYFWAWFFFASLLGVSYIPVGILIWWGEEWRERMGKIEWGGEV